MAWQERDSISSKIRCSGRDSVARSGDFPLDLGGFHLRQGTNRGKNYLGDFSGDLKFPRILSNSAAFGVCSVVCS